MILQPVLSNTMHATVFKTTQGWYDKDNPTVFYKTRKGARLARQASRRKAFSTMPATPTPSPFNSLQLKLLRRLTGKQGVPVAEAVEIVHDYGHNTAASYGHMRAAGATHDEAKAVIAHCDPDLSLRYGQRRAQGLSHTGALA